MTDTQLPTDVDVAILGGGIQGMTALYECARRGLRAILLEEADFGSGASSQSMRILHGGLRYLQSGSFRRSASTAAERSRLLTIADSYTAPLVCRLDARDRSQLFRLSFRTGLAIHGLIARAATRFAGGTSLPRSQPPRWVDGFVPDTEAMLLAWMHTAQELGGTEAHNYASAEELRDGGGRIAALHVAGVEIAVKRLLRCTGARGVSRRVLSANLVVDRLHLHAEDEAIALRHPADGRYVFCVPWGDRSIVGTWNRAGGDGATDKSEWLEEMLAWLRPVHAELAGLEAGRVRAIQAGWLPADSRGEPAERGTLEAHGDGSYTVCTDKWTTARALSSRAVRCVARELGKSRAASIGDRALPPLVDREALIRESALASEGRVETRVRFALERERARSLEDLVLRRLGMGTQGRPGAEELEACVAAAAQLLHWDAARSERERQALASSSAFPPLAIAPAIDA